MGKEEKSSKEESVPKIKSIKSIARPPKKTKSSLDKIPSSCLPTTSITNTLVRKRGFQNLKKTSARSPPKAAIKGNQKIQDGKAHKSVTGNNKTTTSTYSEDGMEWEEISETEVLDSVNQLRKSTSSLQTQITDICHLQANLPVQQNKLLSSVILHVVIDTNIFLSHLVVVKQLVENKESNSKIQLYVPWMVLQELDLIKTKTEHKNKLEVMARKAAMFINIQTSILKNPFFRIQTLSEYKSSINQQSDENADDKILLWCLDLKKELQGKICLLSNDIIFSAKASANGIQSMLSQDFVDQLPHMLSPPRKRESTVQGGTSTADSNSTNTVRNSTGREVLPEENTDRVLPSRFLFQFEELTVVPLTQVHLLFINNKVYPLINIITSFFRLLNAK